MLCVQSAQIIEDNIKKSRFIGIILPCHAESEIVTHLQQLHSQHSKASHIAFAYRIKTEQGFVSRFNDAGEPSGTAGKPIYQHLEGKNLINVLIAVVRYFGGIKLGAGGLTRAYGNCAKLAIEAAELAEYIEYVNYPVQLQYHQLSSFEYQLKKLNGDIIEQQFGAQIELVVRIPEQQLDNLRSIIPNSTASTQD